jgi:8-oxo-dGTP pyrophosphatase MutT (NUDIX family)
MSRKKIVFETPWFNVESEEYDDQNIRGTFYRMNCPDAVTVLPVTPDNKIVLVEQFRPALNKYTLEFPAGGVDDGESIEVSAKRELHEESGYVCDELISIGSGRSIMSRVNNRIHLFYGKNARKDESFVPQEDIEVHLVTLAEFRELVISGQFENLAALGIIMILRWKLGIEGLEGLWT